MTLYLSRLRPDGIVALHISNRHVDLEPVLGRLALDHGLAALRMSAWTDDYSNLLRSIRWQ